MKANPTALLDCRYDKAGTLEVLVKWENLPDSEATWESAPLIHQQFPAFHLEDKVKLHGGGIAMPYY